MDATCSVASRSDQWKTVFVVACLLPFVLISPSVSIDRMRLDFPFDLMLPLLAVWLGRRRRQWAITGLLVLAVLPAVHVFFIFIESWVNFAKLSLPFALVAVLAVTSQSQSAGVPHHRSNMMARLNTIALVLFLIGQFSTRPQTSPGSPQLIDLVGMVTIGLVLVTLPWPAIESWLHPARRRWSYGHSALIVLCALTLVTNVQIGVPYAYTFAGLPLVPSQTNFPTRYSTMSINTLLYGAVFASTSLFGRDWRRVAAVIIACACCGWAINAALSFTDSGWRSGALRSPSLGIITCLLCLAWSGAQFAQFWPTLTFDPAQRRDRLRGVWLMVALLLLVPLMRDWPTFEDRRYALVIACASFIIGGEYSRAALLRCTLLLAGAYVSIIAGASFLHSKPDIIFMTGTTLSQALVAFVPYAMAGLIVARGTQPLMPQMGVTTQRIVDISRLVPAVQYFDNAATVRAFFALLVPAIVLWKISDLASFVSGQPAWLPFRDLVTLPVLLFWLASALSPLLFVVRDWMDRELAFRSLSFAGGVLSNLAMLIMLFGLLGAIAALLHDTFSIRGDHYVAAVAGVSVAILGCWPRGAFRRWRPLLAGILVAMPLLGLGYALIEHASDLGAANEDGDEDGSSRLLKLLISVVAISVGFYWLTRSARFKLMLAEAYPRAWLFGSLAGRGLSARLAALTGLPSSLWHRRAFGEPSFWAFIVARPLVYAGAALAGTVWPAALLLIVGGHLAFFAGKRMAARAVWHPGQATRDGATIVFLRCFEDDQFTFSRPWSRLPLRWFDLWSFRRNIDETMVDEVAVYGTVVGLGRPDDTKRPFGALRHYAHHSDWQATVADAARKAKAIILVAGNSPGLAIEFKLLRDERLLRKTVVLFQPGIAHAQANAEALAFLTDGVAVPGLEALDATRQMVALLPGANGPRLLVADEINAAAYVLALRIHFQTPLSQAMPSAIGPDMALLVPA